MTFNSSDWILAGLLDVELPSVIYFQFFWLNSRDGTSSKSSGFITLSILLIEFTKPKIVATSFEISAFNSSDWIPTGMGYEKAYPSFHTFNSSDWIRRKLRIDEDSWLRLLSILLIEFTTTLTLPRSQRSKSFQFFWLNSLEPPFLEKTAGKS